MNRREPIIPNHNAFNLKFWWLRWTLANLRTYIHHGSQFNVRFNRHCPFMQTNVFPALKPTFLFRVKHIKSSKQLSDCGSWKLNLFIQPEVAPNCQDERKWMTNMKSVSFARVFLVSFNNFLIVTHNTVFFPLYHWLPDYQPFSILIVYWSRHDQWAIAALV